MGQHLLPEGAAPSTPAAGYVAVYAKTDGLLYSKDDAGVETVVTSVLGANVGTFLATPSSANLAAALTDETGTGRVVLNTSPSLEGTVTIGGSNSTSNVKLNINGTMSKNATTLSGLSLSPTLTGGASTTVMRNLIMNATFNPVANNLTLFSQYNQSVFTGTTSPSSLFGCTQVHILVAGALGGTITNLYGYTTALSVNSAATTNITTYAGFQCSNAANGASMTVGTARAFVGGMAAGTNRRNLYMHGTAPNHLAGALMIGSDTDDTVNKLQVTGSIKATTTITTGGYNVATLPAGVTGARAYVTDATAPTWNAALTGGGAVKCPAFYNGSAWVAA